MLITQFKQQIMIYLIVNEDFQTCKIGVTTDLKSRFSTLQSSNSSPLYIYGSIEGDKTVENEVHNKFLDLRKQGEWFYLTKEICDYFNVDVLTFGGKIFRKKIEYIKWGTDDLGSLFQLSSSAKDVLWLIVTRMNSENKIALDKDEINTLVKLSKDFSNIKLKQQKPTLNNFKNIQEEKKKEKVVENKKEIEYRGYTERVIRKAIDELYINGLLIRINKGKYVVHPDIATKANDHDLEIIKMSITYTEQGERYLITEIGKNEKTN